MNAPFAITQSAVRTANLGQPDEAARIDAFVTSQNGSVFHRPQWLKAIEKGTGNRAHGLIVTKGDDITGWLPLTEVHSPIFGRVLASSGFAVEGGILASDRGTVQLLCDAAKELAVRMSCPTIELRGGEAGTDWEVQRESHCSFIQPLAGDDEAQLLQIPRKQRAEVRKGLKNDLNVTVGSDWRDREAHYAVYAESVRNLGTPVFPRSLFECVLDGLDTDILTVWNGQVPVASVLSLYHNGAVMPYWGGGVWAARALRGNDRMYYELMLHARTRGCDRFDFGRSKTESGAYFFKKNWGFVPQPLAYASWTAPGHEMRDADPTSSKHQARIALWKKLPTSIANRLGPLIARGLG